MKESMPPRWADRFLAWYCNPELLEEIQGDAHELYFERLEKEGRRAANFKYIWDVIRFCRLSNVNRPSEFNEPGFLGMFWNLNMKIAIRNSIRNKTIFFVKLSALAICLAFTFLLTGFVINELSYDRHHDDYERIYRVSSKVDFQGKTSLYSISPTPLAPALADEVPGIERATRLMNFNAPFQVDEEEFFGIQTCIVDTSFLRMFHFDYIHGTPDALDMPDRIVITESIARRLFGSTDVVGKMIDIERFRVEVGAVVSDLPLNTHFVFSAFISWKTIIRNEQWDDFNSYTYIKTMPGVQLSEIDTAIASTVKDYISLVSEEYDMKYQPIIHRVDEIHLSGYLEEDFAPKRSRNYVYIILSVIVLFLLTGLFNYLNLALAELTTQVKKIAILRAFGGVHADHRKVAITDAILCLLIVAPVVVTIMLLVLWFPGTLPAIEPKVWTSPIFAGLALGVVFVILMCASFNSIMISKKELLLAPLKGNSSGTQKGFMTRKVLVAMQLSFSIIMIGIITVIVDQFQFVNNNDKGFDDHDVIVVRRRGEDSQTLAFEEKVRAMAGVKLVSGASFFAEGRVEKKDIFELETAGGMKKHLMNFIYCQPDFPALLNLRIKEGRAFDEDHADDRAGRSYLINETMAKELGWDKPIGKKVNGFYTGEGNEGEVVGVVEDFNFESLHNRIEPLLIFPAGGVWGMGYIYIKTEPMQSPALLEAIEREHHALFPEAVFEYDYLDAHYRGLYKHDYEIRDIFRSGLIISILVSALGIFSISALLLSLRTKEMGIRKVVGAANAQLFLMHLKPFAIFFVIALAIGMPVIFYLAGRWLNNFAYHIDLNAMYFVLPALITVVIILGASVYHALRGANVNPVEILKNE